MINERVANFIKLQFSGKTILTLSFGNLREKENEESKEEDRSKRILVLNIICGTIISLIIRADLIVILGHLDRPYEVIGWDKELPKGFAWALLPFGCILTGCFISLGSKFWHDLLDLLLYTKQLKGKLVDARTYEQVNDIAQLQEFINAPEYKLSQLGVDKYRDNIKAIPGVLSVGTGYLKNGTSQIGCVEVHVIDAVGATHIPKELSVQLSAGGTVKIPVKVVVTGKQAETNSADAGKGVYNRSGVLGRGTIGAIVKDIYGDHFVLSCYHVLNGDLNWTRLSDSTDILDSNGASIAQLYFGFRTADMDVAIAKINNGVNFSNQQIRNPASIRSVYYDDVLRETEVNILGAKTGSIVNGFVYNDSWPAALKYPGNSLWELSDLIVLTRIDKTTNNYKTLTQGGDSGALVVDNKNFAIGIIVGGDNAFSYAIKLDKVAKSMDIKL
ncbi:hypothetical protein GCM10011425_36210 [Mucilaginibacter galii]|uniref:Uncharacterized protein n=2 Tax=Mucilaginibacter galii TaxID=2005073 RepID=A0A917JES8_9SPHI|nr:hypothetical protein GCM10011425_36210 [Mucilaginibacter galii]